MKDIKHVLFATVRNHHRRRLLLLVIFSVLAINGIARTVWEKESASGPGSVIELIPGIDLTISESLHSEADTQLVPRGAFVGPHDVEEILFMYHVRFNVSGELHVDVVSFEGSDKQDLNHLFEIEISGDDQTLARNLSYQINLEKVENEAAIETTILVRVRLSTSGTEAEYRALQGNNVTFKLRFRILAKQG